MNDNRKHLIALALALAAAAATGQQVFKTHCLTTGNAAADSFGAGQSVTVSTATCTSEGGPMHGSIVTQHTMWELDKAGGTLVSADGVARKPGSLLVYRLSAGTMNLVLQDGKVTGWTASGSGVWPVATGDASAFRGKSFTWTGKPTGPMQYTIETRVD